VQQNVMSFGARQSAQPVVAAARAARRRRLQEQRGQSGQTLNRVRLVMHSAPLRLPGFQDVAALAASVRRRGKARVGASKYAKLAHAAGVASVSDAFPTGAPHQARQPGPSVGAFLQNPGQYAYNHEYELTRNAYNNLHHSTGSSARGGAALSVPARRLPRDMQIPVVGRLKNRRAMRNFGSQTPLEFSRRPRPQPAAAEAV
jgi:hypothetical protein